MAATDELLCLKNLGAQIMKGQDIDFFFKSWVPFCIYQLISNANPTQFYSKRTGLAVLISR